MDLEETRAFLAVLDHGSFKAAAENVNQPRATLRRRVEALEVRAGVPLLQRSRSGVEATTAGEVLARHGRAMLRETEALLHTLRDLDARPRGALRIGLPAGLPADDLALVFGLFRTKFPELRLELRIADDPFAELVDEVDLILHFADERPTERWVSRPIARFRERLYASASYLERSGTPRSIADLHGHVVLGLHRANGEPETWPVFAGGSIALEPVMITSDPHLLRRFAAYGFGVALLADVDLGRELDDDDDDALVPVLADQVGRCRALEVSVPEVLAETAKLRAILAHLDRFFGPRERPRAPIVVTALSA